MLCLVTTKKWSGGNNQKYIADATNGSALLFNGNRINGIQVRDTTKSQFLFVEDKSNPRSVPTLVEGEGTAAGIVTMADKTWQSSFITLNFYASNDSTAATTATRVNCETIAFVFADPASATRSYVVYYEGGKRREKLCSYSVTQVYWFADGGSLTTSGG